MKPISLLSLVSVGVLTVVGLTGLAVVLALLCAAGAARDALRREVHRLSSPSDRDPWSW